MSLENNEKRREYDRKYRANNRIKLAKYFRAYQRKRRKENPEERRKYQRDYRILNRKHIRALQRKSRTGWTEQEYDAAHLVQGGCCAICGISEKELTRSLAADHSSKTGKKRALLCGRCNPGLGCFDDDIERMQKAVEYLKKFS